MTRAKRMLKNSPLGPMLRRLKQLNLTPQQREWQHRMRRDDAATSVLIRQELRDGRNAVDVGANLGDVLQIMVAASPQGHHFAVEPIPSLARDLQRRFPSVSVHQAALSDQAGEATFFEIEDRPAWSGLRKQDALGDLPASTYPVPLRRLDEIVEETPVHLVKIDVEGAELAVLEGARSIFERDHPTLLLEHAKIHARNYDTESGDVFDLLAECGYTVAPVAAPAQSVDRAEFLRLCATADATGYDRDAITNWVARYS